MASTRVAALKVLASPGGDQVPLFIDLGQPKMTVGRLDSVCDVVLNTEPKILSRLHCTFSNAAGGGRWSVRDENSTNGTWVNGKRLEKYESVVLAEDDEVAFCKSASIKYKFCQFSNQDELRSAQANYMLPNSAQSSGKCGKLSWVCETFRCSPTPPAREQAAARSASPVSLPGSTASASSSAVPNNSSRKRGRSESSEACAFSTLINTIKASTKRLCASVSCNKEEEDALWAAAAAACEAANALQKRQTPKSDETSQQQQAQTFDKEGKIVGCMPLADGVGVPNCIPLISPASEKVKRRDTEKPATTSSVALDSKQQSALKRKMSELRTELTCSICQDPFLFTNTLDCGHSYCQPCVDSWLAKRLSCPICRSQVQQPPTQSLTIDKAVEVTLKSSNKAAYEALLARQKEYEKEQQKDQQCKEELEKQLAQATKKGLKFVHISKPWSENEQCRFLKGLKGYKGPSRVTYCKSASLTERFIQRAIMKDLTIAARNVKLGSTGSEAIECMDAVSLRKRLHMFVKYS